MTDAGMTVPADPDTFPPEERISGEHLAVKNDVESFKSFVDREVAGQ